MATIKKFEDLEVWQMARDLNKKIYPHLMKFSELKYFDLKSQLDSAAGSVMDNISEGFERDGNREFIQALYISKGSLGEVRSQLYRAFDRELITEKEFNELNEYCIVIASKLANFTNYLINSSIKGRKFKNN